MSDGEKPSLDVSKDMLMKMLSQRSERNLEELLKEIGEICKVLGIPNDDIGKWFLISIEPDRLQQELEKHKRGEGPCAPLAAGYQEFARNMKNEQAGKSATERFAGTPALLDWVKEDFEELVRKLALKLGKDFQQEGDEEFANELANKLAKELAGGIYKDFSRDFRISIDRTFTYSIYPDPDFFSKPNLTPLEVLLAHLTTSQPGGT